VRDPSDFACLCGHYEGSHRTIGRSCRVKKCGCKEFLNRRYLDWLHDCLKLDIKRLFRLERDFLRRSKMDGRWAA
jgi:hypothetical protein